MKLQLNYDEPHLPEAPTLHEKYSYIIRRPLLLKLLYIFGTISGIGVLIGYINFFDNNIWYWLFIAPLVFYVTIYQLFSTYINMFYEKLSASKHRKTVDEFWLHNQEKYKVNVFLPICGEDLRILRNTWEGVQTLKNSHYQMEAVVLDDQGKPEVENLAKEFGFTYMSRPNKGEMKKAGNLKYGFVNTDGDFIVILDADFKPREDFIIDTLPYMQDPKIGIVQTPQFFDSHYRLHQKSALQAGAGNIQEYFYRIIQTSRNAFGGSICVGSCALYRRKALNEVGGTAQVEHSEDVHTGFSLVNKGWKLKYMPLILSKGVCPDDMHAFFKQQTRWCSGSMSMMTNPQFWQSKIPLMTKLCYISGFAFYISNPIKLVLVFQTFLLLWFSHSTVSMANLILFVPMIINAALIQYFYIYPKPKPGTILAHASTVWFYSYTVISLFIFKHTEGWKPTGAKQSVSKGFRMISRASGIFLVSYLVLILTMLTYNRIDYKEAVFFPILFWIVINSVYHSYFWYNIQKYTWAAERSD
jgi:cellulose synthase (UDP-forming)